MNIFILLAISVLIIVLTRILNKKNLIRGNYPPGPRGLPVFGHLLFLGRNPSVKFLKWKNIYGSIFSLRFGSIPTVVINDVKLIKEALSLESFSGRPVLSNYEAVNESKGIGMTDGPGQAEQRNFAIKSFKEVGLAKSELEVRIHEEMIKIVQGLKSKLNKKRSETIPTDTLKKSLVIKNKLFQIPVVNSIWVAIIGKSFQANDPDLERLNMLLQNFADTYSSLVAKLSWFSPQLSSLLSVIGINKVTNAGKKLYLFVDAKLEQRSSTGDILLASVETTVAALDWLLIHMAREPNSQQKLQLEIDRVLQTPSASDRKFSLLSVKKQMPYTEAVINELLRISSVIPLGLFHRAVKDVHFHGYDIPKDTLIVPNLYGANYDSEIWEQPQKFIPERFLGSDAVNVKHFAGDILAFGCGKRACIGEQFARNILFVAITSFFQHFSVSHKDNIPSLDGHFAISFQPHNFELFILERVATH